MLELQNNNEKPDNDNSDINNEWNGEDSDLKGNCNNKGDNRNFELKYNISDLKLKINIRKF